MGEIIPGECITNTLHESDSTWTILSSDRKWVQIWEDRQQKLAADHAVAASAAAAEPIEKDN